MSNTKAEKVVPEQFPLTIGGNVQWVKRGQYTKHVAEQGAILFKTEFLKSHLEEMLTMAEKGKKELAPEMPEEAKKLFESVLKDWDVAVAKVKDDQAELERKEKEAEDAKAEKEAAEDRMYLSIKEQDVDLNDLLKKFDTGSMDRCVPKGKVSDEELLLGLKAGVGIGNFGNWMIGDIVTELENRGQTSVCAKLAEGMGVPFSNVYNASKTARAVPPEQRKLASYTVFAEIANASFSKKPEEQAEKMKELIDKVVSGEIKNSQEARKAKDEAKGKTPPVALLPEADPKRQFVIVDHENQLVETVLGVPVDVFAKGATIIDLKTGKMLASLNPKTKPENRWVDLPIYKKPEAEAPAPKKAAAAKKK